MEGFFLNPKVWAICVLVFLSGLISGLETAFVSANRLRYKELSERGDKKAKAIWSLYKNPNGVIGALLVGNNAVNIIASALATDVALELAGDWGVATASGLMIFIILVAGEITPKSIAFQRANDMVESMWWLLKGFTMVFWPLVFVLGQIADILSRPFKASWKNVKVLPDIDVEDLKAMISAIRNVEVDKEMIRGVLALPDKDVHEVMVPRIDMVCVDADTTVGEAVDVILRHGHTRIPVYEGTIDNIIGYVHAKRLLAALRENKSDIPVSDYIEDVLFVPETKGVRDLLKEMQRRKIHIAIVLDEYGGTAGLVTLEDLLEEIVGEIEDEYDREVPHVVKVGESQYIVDARANVREVNEELEKEGIRIPESDDYDTVGGFVMSALGHIPDVGEEITIGEAKITVVEVNGKRVKKVRVERGKEPIGEKTGQVGEG